MAYKFQPGKIYRMPTHFGPATGPRCGPAGRKFACEKSPKAISYSVSFLTSREQLESLLPEGFRVGAEPVVTVAATFMTEIEWLAGRGYNVLGVSFPAVFQGKTDRAAGDFLAVLWENMADPIITGRDELGFSKIYCEIPEPVIFEGTSRCSASWYGFKFLDLQIQKTTPVPPADFPKPAVNLSPDGALNGILHYKYIPRTGEWGAADAAYAVLTPAAHPNQVITEKWTGAGSLTFHRPRWEDMPTQYTIVNGFADLEIKAWRGAAITKTVGGKDLSDQRILQ